MHDDLFCDKISAQLMHCCAVQMGEIDLVGPISSQATLGGESRLFRHKSMGKMGASKELETR